MSLIRYFRGQWPDPIVPAGEPPEFFYEVEIGNDVVLRSVEIFDDRTIARNSLEIERRCGFSLTSLVDQPFMPVVEASSLEEVTSEMFEDLWSKGIDTLFWSAAPNDLKPSRS
jgi:hypothetical protein